MYRPSLWYDCKCPFQCCYSSWSQKLQATLNPNVTTCLCNGWLVSIISSYWTTITIVSEVGCQQILLMFPLPILFRVSQLYVAYVAGSGGQLLSCVWLLQPLGLKPTRLLYPWDSPGKILEWAPISFSRGSSWLRDQIQVSYSAGRFFTNSQPIPNIWMWGSGAGGTGAQPPCLKGKTLKGLACRSYQPLTNLGCLISHRYSESFLHKLPEHLPLRVFFWGTQAKTAYKGFPVCF